MTIEYRVRPDWDHIYRYMVVAVFLSVIASTVAANSFERFLAIFGALFTARQIVSGSPTRRVPVT